LFSDILIKIKIYKYLPSWNVSELQANDEEQEKEEK